MEQSQETSGGRRWIVPIVATLISLLLLELLSFVALVAGNRILTEPILTRNQALRYHEASIRAFLDRPDRITVIDSELGWVYRTDGVRETDTLNSAGIRASRDYAPLPTAGTPRVAAFGDSFVYCNEVSNPECWASFLEDGYEVEALNYGVGGYGVDQAFLRYLREGRRFAPETVLIGFAPVDLRRIVNRYRGFISVREGPWFKPRFLRRESGHELVPSPIGSDDDLRDLLSDPELFQEIGQDDHWYRPAVYESLVYQISPTVRLVSALWERIRQRTIDPERLYVGDDFNPASEAFQLHLAILSEFADSVRASGAEAVVLMLPNIDDVRRGAGDGGASYGPLAEALADRGETILDPLEAFRDHPVTEELFRPGGHYSGLGNQILAGELARHLGLRPRTRSESPAPSTEVS